MNLSYVITRGFTGTNHQLWELVIGWAACSDGGLSPEEWYPASAPAAVARQEAAAAIAVCGGCAVRRQCLELSLRNWAVGQHGVWGGTVPAERADLRLQRVAQLIRNLDPDGGRDGDAGLRRNQGAAA